MAKKSTAKQKTDRAELKMAAAMYHFMLNPYPDSRLSSCPVCGKKSGQRKTPLVIHIDPNYPILLNYTCRYCAKCDLLMGHKAEIEGHLTQLFTTTAPHVIGNDYLVFGTMDRKTWRENMKNPRPLAEMMDKVHPFKDYSEMRRTYGGWFKDGVEPPEEPPPPSKEWVKQPPQRTRK